MIIDPSKVEAVIAEIADEEISSRFGALKESDITTKSGPNDFVTAADHAAEARLEKALLGLYPGAAFIGEEAAAADPDLVKRLDHERGAFWIVDPLDGTRNFVQKREEFGTIIALVENGETRQGWIYAIPEKSFATGSLGDGVTWQGDRLSAIGAAAGTPVGYRSIGSLGQEWQDTMVPALRAKTETGPARCSAYAYINLVRGERDFALYSRVHPWDHAAGVMMLGEIGGRAAYLDNLMPYAPRLTVGRPLLAAGNVDSWEQIRSMIS